MDRTLARLIQQSGAGMLIALGLSAPAPAAGPELPAAAILQLEAVRSATARFHDVAVAEAEGYVDIGLFLPNMGWHYLKEELLDAQFDAVAPELLVYADDPCGGPRRLVAVEYAVPLALSRKAPSGFPGSTDEWAANQDFQLWTLHAWIWEYNPAGVFAPMNMRVP
jgi:hypothetical protein